MSIKSLAQILPPPTKPIDSVGSWRLAEASLRTELPSDYKEFIAAYGSGTINKFITILNPFAKDVNINLLTQTDRQLQALAALERDFGETHPFESFPTQGGLLPVALSDNGDVIYWCSKGEPDEWSIIVNESRSPEFEKFGNDLTTFLTRSLSGEIWPKAFPRGWVRDDPTFTSL